MRFKQDYYQSAVRMFNSYMIFIKKWRKVSLYEYEYWEFVGEWEKLMKEYFPTWEKEN